VTSDLAGTLRWAHQTNIVRYQKLLKTYLTDHERRFIERRLADEVEALRQLGMQSASMDPWLDQKVEQRL
jgi:hypothetical protein